MTISGVQNDLPVSICTNVGEAIRNGFFYRPPVYKPVRIERAVIVKGGTESGASTVDLIFVDESGQKHVCMLTMKLFKALVAADVAGY